MIISTELARVWIVKGKKFFTKEEAEKHRDKLLKNKKWLSSDEYVLPEDIENAEKHFNGEDIKPDLVHEKSDVREMTYNLIKAGEKGIDEVWAQEIALWSPTLKYAGRVDLVGLWKGIPTIVDFKTSKKKKNIKQIKDYYVQCTAYAYAHNELFNTNIKQI